MAAQLIGTVWLGLGGSLLVCCGFSLLFVASLYFRSSGLARDHPVTVRRRLENVFVACCLILCAFCCFVTGPNRFSTALTLLGIRLEGLFNACLLPLLLTAILFLGPLVLELFEGEFSDLFCSDVWLYALHQFSSNLLLIRNVVASPVAEELVFRACMVPLLAPHFSCIQIMLISPLMFGVCHAHHLIDKVKNGEPFLMAFLGCLFQIAYTTIFGAYSVFLFLRTGHLIAPVLVHAFCNHMGFPKLDWIAHVAGWRRAVLAGAFVAGLGLWTVLLRPLTTPELFANAGGPFQHCHTV